MTDPQSGNPAPHAWRFNPRAFLTREWPYLLILLLALFGVAYTSFSKSPITIYWVVLAPFIGVICVVTRTGDLYGRRSYCGMAYLLSRDRIGSWGPRNRLVRTIDAASPIGGRRSRGDHRAIFLA